MSRVRACSPNNAHGESENCPNDLGKANCSGIVEVDADDEVKVESVQSGEQIQDTATHSDTESMDGANQNGDERSCNVVQNGYQNRIEISDEIWTHDITKAVQNLENSFSHLNVELRRNTKEQRLHVGKGKSVNVWSKIALFIDRVFFVVLVMAFITIISFYSTLLLK